MEYIALDPGTSTGWARFSNGVFTEFGTLRAPEEFYPWLKAQHPDLFVVEDYKVRPIKSKGFDHVWSNVFPAQVIGAIQFHALVNNIPVVLQQPSIKGMGSRMAFNRSYVKGHGKHHEDAIIHGVYYWRTVGSKDHETT